MSQNQGAFGESGFLDFENHIGETVTIFTTSGGESGSGFTGVIIAVNCKFVRLVTRIGPAPGCALGNECDDDFRDRRDDRDFDRGRGGFCGCGGGRRDDRRRDDRVRSVGSIVDIPIDRIAAVVYNSI